MCNQFNVRANSKLKLNIVYNHNEIFKYFLIPYYLPV